MKKTTKNKSRVNVNAPAIINARLDDVKIALAEKSLYQFTIQAWPIVEPKPFVEGWHIGAIAEHLEACTLGQILKLGILVPPRHSKSTEVCVMWPSWEWGPNNTPESQWLCMSYASKLSTRDSVRCRNIIQSKWYQERWASRYLLVGDQNAKERYNNDKNGYRIASSVGGVGTGEGGTRLVIDDPHNIKNIDKFETQRVATLDWYDQVMPTRENDPKATVTALIMQRSHHRDLAGHIQEQALMDENSEWTWLILPCEYDSRRRCVTSIGWEDPRKKDGDLLWENRFGAKEVKALKKRLGAHGTAAQLQQIPSPVEGSIFKKHWFKYYSVRPAIKDFEFIFQSWDLAFKATNTSAYVAGLTFGCIGPKVYLLDRVREHFTFTETCTAILEMTKKWPTGLAKLIEDAANGPAVIDTLRQKIPGILAITPKGTKEGRAHAVSPDVEAGGFYLPSTELASWVDDYVEQLSQFPFGAYKDDMDATTQGLDYARKKQRITADLAPVVSMTREAAWVGSSL